jgi:hypothetical protein
MEMKNLDEMKEAMKRGAIVAIPKKGESMEDAVRRVQAKHPGKEVVDPPQEDLDFLGQLLESGQQEEVKESDKKQPVPNMARYLAEGFPVQTLRPVNFVGAQLVEKHRNVNFFNVEGGNILYEEPMSIDLSQNFVNRTEASMRCNGNSYDNVFSMVKVYKKSTTEAMNVGSVWKWVEPTITFNEHCTWGDVSFSMSPAFQGISLSMPEQGSFQSWNAIQHVFGSVGNTMPSELIGNIRMLDRAKTNSVRFMWRLAYLYCHAIMHSGDQNIVTKVGRNHVENITDVESFTAEVDAAQGRNIIPFVCRNSAVNCEGDMSVLALACCQQLMINRKKVMCWPDCGDLRLLLFRNKNVCQPMRDLKSDVIWSTAIAWCANYGDVEIFKELVETIMILHMSVNKKDMFNGNVSELSLPMMETGPLVLAALAVPVNIDIEMLRQPYKGELLQKAVVTRAMLQLCVNYHITCAAAWFAANKTLKVEDSRGYWSMMNGSYRPQCWKMAQSILEVLECKGNIGRIFGTMIPVNDFKAGITNIARSMKNGLQWEEVMKFIGIIPSCAGIWTYIYPLVMEKKAPFSCWSKAEVYQNAASIEEALATANRFGARFALKITGVNEQQSIYEFKPIRHTSGRLADYAFQNCMDLLGRRYDFMFIIEDRDNYFMIRDEESGIFSEEVYWDNITQMGEFGTSWSIKGSDPWEAKPEIEGVDLPEFSIEKKRMADEGEIQPVIDDSGRIDEWGLEEVEEQEKSELEIAEIEKEFDEPSASPVGIAMGEEIRECLDVLIDCGYRPGLYMVNELKFHSPSLDLILTEVGKDGGVAMLLYMKPKDRSRAALAFGRLWRAMIPKIKHSFYTNMCIKLSDNLTAVGRCLLVNSCMTLEEFEASYKGSISKEKLVEQVDKLINEKIDCEDENRIDEITEELSELDERIKYLDFGNAITDETFKKLDYQTIMGGIGNGKQIHEIIRTWLRKDNATLGKWRLDASGRFDEHMKMMKGILAKREDDRSYFMLQRSVAISKFDLDKQSALKIVELLDCVITKKPLPKDATAGYWKELLEARTVKVVDTVEESSAQSAMETVGEVAGEQGQAEISPGLASPGDQQSTSSQTGHGATTTKDPVHQLSIGKKLDIKETVVKFHEPGTQG